MNRGTPFSSTVGRRFLQHGSGGRVLLIVVGPILVVAVYALGLLIAVPSLVERELQRYTDASPGRTAQVEHVRVNPFTLNLELTRPEVRDARAEISFAASRISMKFSVASLLERRPIVDALMIEQPRLRYGSLSAMALPTAPLGLMRINNLEVSDGEWQLVDRTGSGEERVSLNRISVTATVLDGRAADSDAPSAEGQFTLRAFDAGGAELSLNGSLPRGFTRANGHMTVTGLDLADVSSWLGPQFLALSLSGSLDVSSDYVFTAALDSPAFEAIDARAELYDLRLEPVAGFIASAPLITSTVSVTLEHAGDELTWHARVEVADGRFDLVDARMSAPTLLAFSNVTALLVAGSQKTNTVIDVEGALLSGGAASLAVDRPATELNDSSAINFELQQVPATTLAPYAAQSLGRALVAGRVDLKVDASVRGERVDGVVGITSTKLEFEPAQAASAQSLEALPLELVAALLEDPHGVIELSLPLASSTSRGVAHAVAEKLRTHIASIAAAPFEELGRLLDRDGAALNAVPFDPAAAGLNEEGLETVSALGEVLRERPALGLRVPGGFDPAIDRDALARQQIELHVLLATAGPSPKARPEPVNFASSRVQDVIDEFAGERLGPAQIAAIAARFDVDGTVDGTSPIAFYRAVFDALVADEEIASGALTRLGRFRAQAIANALTQAGIAMERIEVGRGDGVVTTVNQDVYIPIDVQVLSR